MELVGIPIQFYSSLISLCYSLTFPVSYPTRMVICMKAEAVFFFFFTRLWTMTEAWVFYKYLLVDGLRDQFFFFFPCYFVHSLISCPIFPHFFPLLPWMNFIISRVKVLTLKSHKAYSSVLRSRTGSHKNISFLTPFGQEFKTENEKWKEKALL